MTAEDISQAKEERRQQLYRQLLCYAEMITFIQDHEYLFLSNFTPMFSATSGVVKSSNKSLKVPPDVRKSFLDSAIALRTKAELELSNLL